MPAAAYRFDDRENLDQKEDATVSPDAEIDSLLNQDLTEFRKISIVPVLDVEVTTVARHTSAVSRTVATALKRNSSIAIRSLAIAVLIMANCGNVKAEPNTSHEYKLKLAYLYNFARYVIWPRDAFSKTDEKFVIGILGKDPFGSSIDGLAACRRVENREVVVARFKTVNEIQRCHILFVTAEWQPDRNLYEKTKGHSVLIVCESHEVFQSGAVVGFYNDSDGTIGFSINVDAVNRQRLTVHAPVLELARLVRDHAGALGALGKVQP